MGRRIYSRSVARGRRHEHLGVQWVSAGRAERVKRKLVRFQVFVAGIACHMRALATDAVRVIERQQRIHLLRRNAE